MGRVATAVTTLAAGTAVGTVTVGCDRKPGDNMATAAVMPTAVVDGELDAGGDAARSSGYAETTGSDSGQ